MLIIAFFPILIEVLFWSRAFKQRTDIRAVNGRSIDNPLRHLKFIFNPMAMLCSSFDFYTRIVCQPVRLSLKNLHSHHNFKSDRKNCSLQIEMPSSTYVIYLVVQYLCLFLHVHTVYGMVMKILIQRVIYYIPNAIYSTIYRV